MLPFQTLRLNVTHGLSAPQVQDCAFVLFCVCWKTLGTLSCNGEGGLNLAFLQGQAQRMYSPNICLIELLNYILSVREVSANLSLQRIKNLNKRLTDRMNQFLILFNDDF